MVANPSANVNQAGPNLESLGLKSPMEVIDILGMLKIDGDPVIKDDKAFLDPRVKAKEVMEYFMKNFNVNPKELPHLASVVKHEMKRGLKA